MNRIAAFAFAFTFLALAAVTQHCASKPADPPHVDMTQVHLRDFNRVTDGMTLIEVQRVLGAKGEQIGMSRERHTTLWTWAGDDPSPRILVHFYEDHVIEKFQVGLVD